MATTKRKNLSEQEAEQKVYDSIADLDDTRLSALKSIADAQGWKSAVLLAELERLKPVLSSEHPRLVRLEEMRAHYEQSREAIAILVKGKEEGGENIPPGTWELTGIVRYDKLESPAGLKVVLEPQEKQLDTLEAECNADGYYRIAMDQHQVPKYIQIPLLLKIYYRAKKPIYTAKEPIFIRPGVGMRQDINI